jgi:tetratricopeptide (TPR) repeat protein
VAGADRDTTLASLVDKSLLRYADARYAMLETVREFAEERLEESGDGDAAQQRHAESMVARAAPVAEAFERGENRLDALAPDWDDLRAALAFLEETGQTDLGLQLIGSTWPLWYMRGASLEGRRWAVGPLARSEGERSARRARALLAASVFAAAIGDFEHAEDFAIESLAIQHELGETRTRPPLLTNLGIIAHQRGDFVAAERLYAESAREAHATQNGFQRAVALENLAELAMRDGDYARAGELSDEAMALFDDLDSDWGRAWSLIDRAYCLHGAGREDEAIVAASRSLVLARGIRAASALWPGAVLVAAVAAKQGEPEIALGVIRAADVLSRSTPEVVPVGIQSELYRETVDELRRALGPERYDASSAEQTMSPEGATQEILDSAARLSGEPASHG